VVRDMTDVKAPRLDGFSMACFQKCWEVMKEDILQVFKEFHSSRKFEKSFNPTFVSLRLLATEILKFVLFLKYKENMKKKKKKKLQKGTCNICLIKLVPFPKSLGSTVTTQ
jgi:hypothetical protein